MRVDLSEVLKAAGRPPTAPAVALRLVEQAGSDDVPVSALVELVGVDPVLSARLLKTANSPSLGDTAGIGSLPRAAEVIGPGGVKASALSFGHVGRGDACPAGFDLIRFWQTSLACAVAASAIAEQTQNIEPDEAYAAGLLRRFGRLVLATTFPAHYERVLERVAGGACTLLDAEAELLGTTHLATAAQLFDAWRFPQQLCEAIEQLAEIGAEDSTLPLAHVLFAAESLAQQFNDDVASGGHRPRDREMRHPAGASSADQPAHAGRSPRPAPDALPASLGIDSSRWRTLCVHASRRWRKCRRLLEMPANATMTLEQIDTEARERLAELAVTSQLQLRKLASRQDELVRGARTDPLTLVANRPAFDERLELEIDRARRSGRPLAVLLADVDHFKAVNDRYGHAAGDEVLRCVARAVNDATRSVDLVARYGGDEFAVIAAECTLDGARKLVERLRSAVEKAQVDQDGRRLRVSVSVGAAVAHWPEHLATPEALFAAADAQLYAAKGAGRNCARVQRIGGEVLAAAALPDAAHDPQGAPRD